MRLQSSSGLISTLRLILDITPRLHHLRALRTPMSSVSEAEEQMMSRAAPNAASAQRLRRRLDNPRQHQIKQNYVSRSSPEQTQVSGRRGPRLHRRVSVSCEFKPFARRGFKVPAPDD